MAPQAATFDSVMRDLRQKRYYPVYILMGDEPYFIDKISNYIEQNVLTEDEKDFNLMTVYGSETTAGAISDMAKRYPMMSERQVVVVKEAQTIKNWDRVEQYLDNPQPSTVLVICNKGGNIEGRRKILSKARSKGVVFESKKKRDKDLSPFIDTYVRSKGAVIEPKAAQMFADNIGSDLSRLTSEIDKVVLSFKEGESKTITALVVEQKVGISKDFNPFEFRAAIARRDVKRANVILNYFDKNPKSGGAFVLIPTLFNYFQNLLLAYYVPNKSSRDDVAHFLDLRSAWMADEYIMGLRNFSGVKVMQIINKIRQTDTMSKGLDNPDTPVGELMRELVFFIFH